MKFKSFIGKIRAIMLFLPAIFIFISCDKAENLLLSDSEILMKELKGTYNLVSVRHEDLSSNNGGFSYDLQLDTTFNATGSLDLGSIDKADYTGSISINYNGSSETHAINGSASVSGDYEKLWVITNGGESIQSMILFNPPASYMEGWLDERDDDYIVLRISETAIDYSAHKNRFYRFEKAK